MKKVSGIQLAAIIFAVLDLALSSSGALLMYAMLNDGYGPHSEYDHIVFQEALNVLSLSTANRMLYLKESFLWPIAILTPTVLFHIFVFQLEGWYVGSGLVALKLVVCFIAYVVKVSTHLRKDRSHK
ncbi:MAG: hypothetical protein ABL949_12120 [Fimbriimonadaceae bacterium]